MKRYPCSGCSLLCDDLLVNTDGLFIVDIYGACLKGYERFSQVTAKNRITTPMIRNAGKLEKAPWDEALNKTMEILNDSQKPLIYGLSTSSCEAQAEALKLAKNIHAIIDSNSSICQGQVLNIVREKGITLTTITEIVNKTDLIILWGANPAESIPRLLNKTLFTRGKFRMTGREIRTLIIIDPVKTSSFNVMGVRDIALNITPGSDLELIKALQEECCNPQGFPSGGISGLDKEDMKRLLINLSESENIVIIIGQGILRTSPDNNVIEELLNLVHMINEKQQKGRISVMLMGGHYNMMGFEHVALNLTGSNHNIEFENGELVKDKRDYAISLLRDDFDSLLVVGTDPISHLPSLLSSKLSNNPIIVVDNKRSATTELADVVLPTAITGIETEGLAIRLDNVPVFLKKIINPPSGIPSDYELLQNLNTKLLEKKGEK